MTATVGPFDLSESVEFDSTIQPHPSQCVIVPVEEKQKDKQELEDEKWERNVKKKVTFHRFISGERPGSVSGMGSFFTSPFAFQKLLHLWRRQYSVWLSLLGSRVQFLSSANLFYLFSFWIFYEFSMKSIAGSLRFSFRLLKSSLGW